MTHDTNNDSPSSQDELLAHVIPMRHRAPDQTQLQDEEPTDEHTQPGEHTLWDPSSDPPLPRRRNTSAPGTDDTAPAPDAGLAPDAESAPDVGAPAHRSSPRALRAALAGVAAAVAVGLAFLALHGQAGATPRPPALLSNTPPGSATIAPESPARPHKSKKSTTHAPQPYQAPTRSPRYTPAAPPTTVTGSAPASAPAQSPSVRAEQEFGIER